MKKNNDYFVTLIEKNGCSEFTIFRTPNKEEAIERARDEHARHGHGYTVEVRKYVYDIHEEDCSNFDYDLIEFLKNYTISHYDFRNCTNSTVETLDEHIITPSSLEDILDNFAENFWCDGYFESDTLPDDRDTLTVFEDNEEVCSMNYAEFIERHPDYKILRAYSLRDIEGTCKDFETEEEALGEYSKSPERYINRIYYKNVCTSFSSSETIHEGIINESENTYYIDMID
jgi:hypothetical protein